MNYPHPAAYAVKTQGVKRTFLIPGAFGTDIVKKNTPDDLPAEHYGMQFFPGIVSDFLIRRKNLLQAATTVKDTAPNKFTAV
ncbi:hypothetical protein SDC9_161843 [bioreactor metagenome]|uniref:Uncharacterized protein n=1 Tax=bioreactor metagenome TaxID=1076179 RepID=A0A645FLG4_9ZZZZ